MGSGVGFLCCLFGGNGGFANRWNRLTRFLEKVEKVDKWRLMHSE